MPHLFISNARYPPVTYYIQRLYSLSIPIYIIAALTFFDGSVLHWCTLFLTAGAMGLLFSFTSCFMMWRHETDLVKVEEKAKFMKMGLKWMSFFGIVPLIFVYTIGWEPCFLTSTLIICTFAAEEFNHKIYSVSVGHTTVDYSTCPKLTIFLALLHVVMAFLGINYAAKFKSQEDFIAVLVYQIIFLVFFGTCTIDYILVKVTSARINPPIDSIEIRQKPIQDQNKEVVSVCEKLAKADPTRLGNGLRGCSLACSICLLEYNELIDLQTPRILYACGHTYCNSCLKRLVQFSRKITCPSCRVETIVGVCTELPKNFGLISVLREVNGYLESVQLVNEIAEGKVEKKEEKE